MSLYTAWQSGKQRSDISLDRFLAVFQDAECHDVHVGGQDVGAILVLGPEIHACIKPEGFGRWFNKRTAAVLAKVIKRHGYATTTVTAGNEVGHRFVTRLGFDRVQVGDVWQYRKEDHGL